LLTTLLEGATEVEIRASLKKEEQEAVARGQAPLHATSATAFLAAGLQLEETQYVPRHYLKFIRWLIYVRTSTVRRRIKAGLAAGNITADRESKVEEHRLAFVAKLRKFRELQAVYTPGAVRMIQKEETSRDPDLPAPSPEHIRLWLPSELPPAERTGSGCQRNVVDMEVALREGQAENALVSIRGRLHSKRYLINFKNLNLTGQKKTTRAHTVIAQLDERINLTASKYRDARAALTSVKGADYAPHLKLLNASDIALEGETARDPSEAAKSDREALKRLAKIGGRTTQPLRSDASAKKAPGISWIWLQNNNGLDVSEQDLHDCASFSPYGFVVYAYSGCSVTCGMGASEGAEDAVGRGG
jgi:hypothetical protein